MPQAREPRSQDGTECEGTATSLPVRWPLSIRNGQSLASQNRRPACEQKRRNPRPANNTYLGAFFHGAKDRTLCAHAGRLQHAYRNTLKHMQSPCQSRIAVIGPFIPVRARGTPEIGERVDPRSSFWEKTARTVPFEPAPRCPSRFDHLRSHPYNLDRVWILANPTSSSLLGCLFRHQVRRPDERRTRSIDGRNGSMGDGAKTQPESVSRRGS